MYRVSQKQVSNMFRVSQEQVSNMYKVSQKQVSNMYKVSQKQVCKGCLLTGSQYVHCTGCPKTIENRIYREELKESLGMNFFSPFQPERESKVYKSCKCSQIICSRVH